MGNRRFTQVSTSDEEDEVPRKQQQKPPNLEEEEELQTQRKRKRMKLQEDGEEEQGGEKNCKSQKRRSNKGESEKEATQLSGNNVGDDDDEDEDPEPSPIGEVVRVSGKGRGRRSHYEAFEYDGNRYELEDPVVLIPEDKSQKPYVAIIKDITQKRDGSMMVTGQWFYRPEEAEKKGGGNWESNDTRMLFYSFHRDEVPAESVMHKCVVHFVPLEKKLPLRKKNPGFIVQKVYDTIEKKLWKLTDKDYEDSKQHEIDLLVQKTMSRLGDLPDLEPEEGATTFEDLLKGKRIFRRKTISPIDVSRNDEATIRCDQNLQAETPANTTSESYNILVKFDVLTGETQRDKWLEKLLHGIQYLCYTTDSTHGYDKGKSTSENKSKPPETTNGSQGRSLKSYKSFLWPDAAVPVITALEQVANDALSSDFQKYNQKMRQLVFNLKQSPLLARRLLNGELEPLKILNMSPNELKEGITAEETPTEEPDDLERMQMTDARCSRCNECKVGLRDIIQAGHGERYKLECIGCGHSWYASRDEVSSLTIDTTDATKNVGTAPWATAKFEDVEKQLLSPREANKSATDLFKKTSEAYMPVLEKSKSFNKSRKEDNP